MKKSEWGYVKFSLIGTDCEEFLSCSLNSGIKIYDIENDDGVIYAKTYPSQYFLLARMIRDFHVRMRITEKRGLWFIAYRYRNRYGIAAGLLAYGLVLLLCSGIVWDITITGNERISDESILEFLAENGIYPGASRKDLDTTVTELKALLSFEDLAWVSIESEGSRVNVKLNERIANAENGLSVSTPCNIVASQGGVIVDAEVYRGTMLYEIGSGVAQGDIIVSGIVNDGAGNISINHADAKIIAEYEEEISFYQLFNTTEKVKTDEMTRSEYLKLFGFTFPQQNEQYTDGYTYTSNRYEVRLFGIKMPWTRVVIEGTRMKDVEVTRTVNDVKRLLEQELEMYELNFLKNIEIVDRKIEYERDENGIRLVCKFTLRGNIASQSEIFYREE